MKTYSINRRVYSGKTFILFFTMIFIVKISTAQNFSSSILEGVTVANPTSLQFGPDGRLYVAQQNGIIKIFSVVKKGTNNYEVTATESITLVNQIPNHNDNGEINTGVKSRQVTGLLVNGTITDPVIYIASSDSRMGAGSTGDVDLCTNSGIISKLTKKNTGWEKIDIVRGLPRSEENHAPNGIQLDEVNNILFVAIGGLTNAGSPSKMFTYSSEYALSAAIISVDLTVLEAMPVLLDATGNHPYKYDLPTLDDPTRSNNPDGSDINDPWGGNDGLNQAKIIEGGPVQVYASGFRNPYDILITKTSGRERRMYTIDNGANASWGGYPKNEGTDGTVTNEYVPGEPGSTGSGINDPQINNLDGLEFIGNLDTYIEGSYYGGHPCPLRANPGSAGLCTHEGPIDAGTAVWRNSITHPNYPLPSDWPPVPLSMANPVEGDFRNPGETDYSLITFRTSTNGICEYTASNFGMQGDILAVGYRFNGCIYRIRLNDSGDGVLNSLGSKKIDEDTVFASELNKPLDVTAQGDNDPFPGTIWVSCYGDNNIIILEPQSLTPVTDRRSASEILIYPNPFRNQVRIQYDCIIGSTLFVEVYNSLGLRVFECEEAYGAGSNVSVLDMSMIPSGIYQIKIQSDKGEEIQNLKIVKE